MECSAPRRFKFEDTVALNKLEKPFLLVQQVWKSILKGIFKPATLNLRRRRAPHSKELASSLNASRLHYGQSYF